LFSEESMKPIKYLLISVLILTLFLTAPTRTSVVSAPVSGVVTNTNDSGPGSLRQIIAAASPGEVITFDLPYPATITLTSGQISLTKDLTIVGPGAGDLIIDGNASSRVFSITGGANAFLYGLTLQNGSSSGAGGCVYANDQETDVILSHVLVRNCASNLIGGGVHISQGRLTLIATTLTGNSAPDGGGAGLSNLGTLTVINSTIAGNSAASYGGGIADGNGSGIVVLRHSAVVYNTAGNGLAGVGIDLIGGSAALTMDNTIIASGGSRDCAVASSSVTSNGYNIVQNPDACVFSGSDDQIGVDPLVDVTLTWDSDWPTPLHPLTNSSPAIDAGSCTLVNHDQRDFDRPFDNPGSPNVVDGCDIGPYEIGVPFGDDNIVTSINDSGVGSLRQVVAEAPLGAVISFDLTIPAAITLTSGGLVLDRPLVLLGPGADQLTLDGSLNDRVMVINNGGFAAVYGLTLTRGRTTGVGGCLLVDTASRAHFDSTVFTDCESTGSNQVGGAVEVLNDSEMAMVYSLITDSRADYGAAAAVSRGGTLTLSNSTVSGNTARNSGGALADGAQGGTVIVNNSTLADNAGGSGIDFYNTATSLTLFSSIVANNGVNDCVIVSGVTVNSGGYNLVESPNNCTFAGPGDITGVDPALDSLGLNGGVMMSHALLSGSPALDAGSCGGVGYDQRGQTRPEDHFGYTNAADGCDIGAFELAAVSEPTADFSFSANSLLVDFTDTSTGIIDEWLWDFGDGNTSTSQNPSHTYAADGDYTVTLTIFNQSGSLSHDETVSVAVPPVADFSFDASGLDVTFTDLSSGTVDSWLWDFGDGSTSTAQNPGHAFVAGGAYTVSLTVTNAGGQDTMNRLVEVAPVPSAGFSVSANGLEVTFTDTSTGTIDDWSWDFGDGNGSTAQNPTHTYAGVGTFTVALTVSNVSSLDTYEMDVSVAAVPTAHFTYSASVLTVDFTDASTGTIDLWEWDFGDGNSSTDQNPSHTYAAAGEYTVNLTVSNVSSTDTHTEIVRVAETPTAAFGAVVNGLTVTFTDTSLGDIDQWLWDFGDGFNSSLQNPVYTYSTPGDYTVSLTVFNASSTDAYIAVVSVDHLPSSEFSFLVDGFSVQFTDTSTGNILAWEWDFGDGNSSTDPDPLHVYAAAGVYTVRLTTTNAGGSDTFEATVNIAYQTWLPMINR
jgi:PKD repeat protein